MLYLLWVILNIVVFLLYIYVTYKATSLLRQKFGVGVALFFVIGLLSFVSGTGNEKDETSFKPAAQKSVSVNLQEQNSYTALLEDNLAFEIKLDLVTNKATTQTPFETVIYYTHVSGFVAGHKWKPAVATFNYNNSNRTIHYEVHGVIDWKLLGIQLYAQSKVYTGTIAAH